jgi:hypothetical protein
VLSHRSLWLPDLTTAAVIVIQFRETYSISGRVAGGSSEDPSGNRRLHSLLSSSPLVSIMSMAAVRGLWLWERLVYFARCRLPVCVVSQADLCVCCRLATPRSYLAPPVATCWGAKHTCTTHPPRTCRRLPPRKTQRKGTSDGRDRGLQSTDLGSLTACSEGRLGVGATPRGSITGAPGGAAAGAARRPRARHPPPACGRGQPPAASRQLSLPHFVDWGQLFIKNSAVCCPSCLLA